jgi:acetyl-CoA C-acetyltransferase
VGTVHVLGGYQTDFAHNWSRAGDDFADLVRQTVRGTLACAAIQAADIEVIHVGNAFGELFCGQGQLGAMPATVAEELWGIPASRHEAACASGSIAVLAAMADLEAGRYDCALVLGAELEKTVPGDEAAHILGAAAWVGHEGDQARFVWPAMFAELADEYDRRFGLDDSYLHAIAELNHRNARDNPNAQTRSWTFEDTAFTSDDIVNPVVEGRVRRNDCSQMTDGAAGVVLVSDRYLRAHPEAAADISTIEGWGHRTAGLSLRRKLERSKDEPYVLPHVRVAIEDAYRRAGVDVDALDGIEVHDCFAMSEYLAVDHFGLTEPGASWQAIADGTLARDGRLPVNPGGGLIGGGHPVGATGVRMLLDVHKQVVGGAGSYQVPGANRFAMLNIGGSATTTVCLVVASGEG